MDVEDSTRVIFKSKINFNNLVNSLVPNKMKEI